MKEHPIIFSDESIRAILSGRKTQTRRVIKGESTLNRHCPYGMPGAQLWVKEAFALEDATEFPETLPHDSRPVHHEQPIAPYDIEQVTFARYRATETASILCRHDDCEDGPCTHPWRSPLFMPRWASRLTLEIVAVRDERVQEISESDAVAEGYEGWSQTQQDIDDAMISDIPPEEKELARLLGVGTMPAKAEFHMGWDSINAKRGFGWDANPRARAITFRVVERKCDHVESVWR